MSYYDYTQTRTKEIEQASFYKLLMAAIKKADDINLMHLERVFLDIVEEVRARYNAPGGRLKSDEPTLIDKVREAAHKANTETAE